MTNPNQVAVGNSNVSWWIISLAISVVCCAIIFVVFAGFVVGVIENMAEMKGRFAILDQRVNDMSASIETLRTRSAIQQIQILPATAAIQVPNPVSTELKTSEPAPMAASPTVPAPAK